MQKYVFRRYDPAYPAFFALEKKKIAKALGSGAKIEHVGSTKIADLGGKGIIDILVGVSKATMLKAKEKLEFAGYEFRQKASYPERLFFRHDYIYKNRKRRIHIHLTLYNGSDWEEIINFRDYLLTHPKTVTEYAKIKKEGVKLADGDGETYRKHKQEFIETILRKAAKSSN